MKERLLTNWTYIRALYLILGLVVIIQSILSSQWFGVAFGGYFASMGLFGFGCASGNCFSGNIRTDAKQKSNIQDVDFEEIK